MECSTLALRRDRYNKKLMKYYVTFEEGDDQVSENEEIERHQDTEDPHICT